MANDEVDKVKGRAKEAAGALTDDDELREEGRDEQSKGAMDEAKDAASDAVDSAKDAARKAADALKKKS